MIRNDKAGGKRGKVRDLFWFECLVAIEVRAYTVLRSFDHQVESIHLAAVDGRRLGLDIVWGARDDIRRLRERDRDRGEPIRRKAQADGCAVGLGHGSLTARQLKAEQAEDIVETVILLNEDDDMSDGRSSGSRDGTSGCDRGSE